MIVTMLTLLAWNYFTGMGSNVTVITYDEFTEMLEKDQVEKIVLLLVSATESQPALRL